MKKAIEDALNTLDSDLKAQQMLKFGLDSDDDSISDLKVAIFSNSFKLIPDSEGA